MGNMRSGRRPQPAGIRALKGSRERPWHAEEAQHDRAMPACPSFVEADDLAYAKWMTLGEKLLALGVLHSGHGEILSSLCSTWADLERARGEFAECGRRQVIREEYMTPAGEMAMKVKVNPLVTRIDKLTSTLRVLLGEFGLTPMTAAKVRATAPAEGDADPFAALLKAENPYAKPTN